MKDLVTGRPVPKKSEKDIFLASRLRGAEFSGYYEIPRVHPAELERPLGLCLYSERERCVDKAHAVLAFYEYDCRFDGWRGLYNVFQYGMDEQFNAALDELRGFAAVVCPDFSVYGDFPKYKQIESIAKGREAGAILELNGIKVIDNFTFMSPWTLELALSGLDEGQTVSIGSYGALKDPKTREAIAFGIKSLVSCKRPRVIVVYGEAPDSVFAPAEAAGCEIWQYSPRTFDGLKGGDGRGKEI